MASPFTFTPGMAGEAYIDMHYADEIVQNFKNEKSEKYVYKILGLRGSGKSVVYSKVINVFRDAGDWLVYTLSTGCNPINTLIGMISNESFVSKYEKSVSMKTEGGLEGNIALLKGSGSAAAEIPLSPNANFYSAEATLKDMLKIATDKGYRILVGIDDISKTKEMIEFLSLMGEMILDRNINIYLICTGLSKNIEDFAAQPHLSFFVRGDKIETKSLSLPQITYKYKELLDISTEKAHELAVFTRGYAYAYQVLGELLYKNTSKSIDSVLDEFDSIIADQYEIIWGSLTKAEKELAKIIAFARIGNADEIKCQLSNPSSYAVLRSRLIKKHIVIVQNRVNMLIDLPRIKEYLEMWQ